MPGLEQPATVLRLRVVLAGISPLIWRRLEVSATATLAGLHVVLQTAFGWADAHLHRFTIAGVEHGIAYAGGPGFGHDAFSLRLGELGLRVGERFDYSYDFGDRWIHHLRVEAIETPAPRARYPRCVGGARAGPPEDCGGPWAYLALRQAHHPVLVAARTAELLTPLLEAAEGATVGDLISAEAFDELRDLQRWARIDHLDRRALNRALAGLDLARYDRSMGTEER